MTAKELQKALIEAAAKLNEVDGDEKVTAMDYPTFRELRGLSIMREGGRLILRTDLGDAEGY